MHRISQPTNHEVHTDIQATNSLATEIRAIRDITGRSYDREHGEPPERFEPHRCLTVTAIPGAYERPSHVAISISGTPCRGLIIVDLEYENVPALDFWSRRQLSPRETQLLRHFARKVRAMVQGGSSNHWSWSSASLASTTKITS
jgi:hypothetical protein